MTADRHPQRRVVCAAIRNPDTGEVIVGVRHYDMVMVRQIKARSDGDAFRMLHDPNQGFIDQHGVYMDREEAFKVAAAANQIRYPDHCTPGILYSEGLY